MELKELSQYEGCLCDTVPECSEPEYFPDEKNLLEF